MPTACSHRRFFSWLPVLRYKANVSCSAEPRGFCGDQRFFPDSEKKPQVFRNPGGSPALQNETHPFFPRVFHSLSRARQIFDDVTKVPQIA
jgi:hypothetical protein